MYLSDAAYAALVESEKRYRTLAETAQDQIFIIGADGRCEYANSAAARVVQSTPDALIGKRLESLLPADVAAEVGAKVRATRFDRQPRHCEQRLTSPMGKRWFDVCLVPMFGEDGDVQSVMGIARDITDRHRLGELLQRQSGLFNAVLDGSPIGIAVLEGTKFISEIINPALKRLLPDAVAGTRFVDAWTRHGHAVASLLDRVHRTGRAEDLVDVQIDLPSADGADCQRRSVAVTVTPLRLPGVTSDGLLVLVTDTTARKQLEAQFLQAQKMEAIGRLAGGIAHDFNNLLTSIMGYAELVEDSLEPTDRRREDMEEIRRASQSAASLTRQLLTFSRKHIWEPTVVDINAVATQLERIIQRTIGEDIRVNLQLADGLNMVRIDRTQLEQVLMNLSVNARDAMPSGGVLTIGTATADVTTHETARLRIPRGSYVRLSVSDTGIGMTPDVQSHLFEPFFTTKEFGKGTGLGLSTVYGIIQQGGGSISVHSTLGKGTTFTIWLPRITDVVDKAVTSVTPCPVTKGRETVLIVEDNAALRELTRRALEKHGYVTLTAGGADEARTVARDFSGSIDLLLTDIVMPGDDGLVLSQDLKLRQPDMRVIYMSGHTEEVISHHGLLDRDVRFLQKPFVPDALLRTVHAALEMPQLETVSA